LCGAGVVTFKTLQPALLAMSVSQTSAAGIGFFGVGSSFCLKA
jgi:hypothetical protein